MSESKAIAKSTHFILILILSLAGLGCQDQRETRGNSALDAFNAWASNSSQSDLARESCHAYGLIKHPETTCIEMLSHAQKIRKEERHVRAIKDLECFDSVCGDFIEIEIDAGDENGREIKEIAVLKQDQGSFRLYWYRTNSLVSAIKNRAKVKEAETGLSDQDRKQAQLDSAYAFLTNRMPEFFQFPQCLDGRVSSSNLIGDLIPLERVTIEGFLKKSEACPKRICVDLVGKKIAAVCR